MDKPDSMSLGYSPIEGMRPAEHSRICWAAALGGARHLIPLEGWTAAAVLAAERLRAGAEPCICTRRAGRYRGRQQR